MKQKLKRYTQESGYKLILEKIVKSHPITYKIAFFIKRKFLGSLFAEDDLKGIELLKIDPKSSCIDIGANIGQSIEYFKTKFFSIHAFEPNKDNENIDGVKTNRFTENLLKELKGKYKDKAELVGAINLNTNEGQIIIYKSDQEGGIEELFANHELVKKGLMTYYHRQIYFPKGIFCED